MATEDYPSNSGRFQTMIPAS